MHGLSKSFHCRENWRNAVPRGKVTCLRSYSLSEAEWAQEVGSPDPFSRLFPISNIYIFTKYI